MVSTPIFAESIPPTPAIEPKLPDLDEHFSNTPQLTCCLSLLQVSHSSDDILEPTVRNWLKVIEKDTDQENWLKVVAKDVIRAFKRDELMDAKSVGKVVYLAPVLDKDTFRDLLKEFYPNAGPGFIDEDGLIKITEFLSTRLRGTHQQSSHSIVYIEVKDLDRVNLHEPLSSYLNELKGSSDPYLLYQIAHVYQTLPCCPDNETLRQAALRYTVKVKGLDLNKFIEGLGDIQQGLAGVLGIAELVKTAYGGSTSLAESDQGFLVGNPFLMAISLQVLPRMDPRQHLSTTHITRVALYDHFVEQWLERGRKRLGEKESSPQARVAFRNLSDEGFTQNGIEFLKKLAIAIYKEQGGHSLIEYTRLKDEGSWKVSFFSREDKQLLIEACPLTRTSNQHRFIHRSLLEYGLARATFDPHDWRDGVTSESSSRRQGRVSSALSVEVHGHAVELGDTVEQEPDFNSPLAWKSLVNEPSLLRFLEERVQQEPIFKQQLLTYIERSKNDKKWRTAAANAITILIRAGVQFIGSDLQGIQIPGADLSYGVFDSAQLQDADLREVNLRGVWMRCTDLRRSQMTGVQFGELPFLAEEDTVSTCAYSPNGKFIAVGLANGDIHEYATSTWERIRTLSGHLDKVRSVAYSPQGNQIASCSKDGTVRVWALETGTCLNTLIGHSSWVQSVVYSPQGSMMASASDDRSILLWDAVTGDCHRALVGHAFGVLDVEFSPEGNRIISGSTDFTVRLWDVDTGECINILRGHTNKVWSVAYSPNGDLVASSSEDKTIRLWDVETGVCLHIMSGHSSDVYSVAYSPKGDQVASGSQNGTIRIWDVQTGICQQALTGHNEGVLTVAYSPNGDQIASGSFDKTLRLWDVSVRTSGWKSSGHSAGVRSIKCSPNGEQIVSCSVDSTIRLWDTETGASRKTLRGHSGAVFSVAYSPQGGMIASASEDETIRLWDVGSGVCRLVITGHTDWVRSVVFSPQGDQLASGSVDGTVVLWETETGAHQRTFVGHSDDILCVAYSPNGDQITSSSKDHTIRIWDVATGDCCRTLEGHSNWVWSVVYSPQGDQIASTGNDKSVRLWNVETGICSYTLLGHSDEDCVYSIAWSTTEDANYLVKGYRDGSVFMWKVVEEEEDPFRVRLRWSSTSGPLTVTGASVQDVCGLSQLNKQLLQQREAVGEPVHLIRETSKKFKQSSNEMVPDSSSSVNSKTEQTNGF
ncbi:hypothetical protein BGZ65_001795, partial [Modicella reniformis]